MRRKLMKWFAVALMLALTVSTALAAKPHFSKLSLSSTDLGTSTASTSLSMLAGSSSFTTEAVVAEGIVAGLGNIGQVKITLQATGTGTAICTNQGGNQAPGVNPISVNVGGEATVFVDENGSAKFTLQTNGAPAPTSKKAGCPNGRWTVSQLTVDWATVTLTVTDVATNTELVTEEFTCMSTASNALSCKPVD